LTLEEYLKKPDVYSKILNLKQFMYERNLLVDILNALQFQKVSSNISKDEYNILYQKFIARLSVLDRKMNKESLGLICSECKNTINTNENTIACISCGMPFHFDHLVDSIKKTGFCPVCGEFFDLVLQDNFVIFDQSFLKSAKENLSQSFPKLDYVVDGKKFDLEKKDVINGLICSECKRAVDKTWVFCKFCGKKLKDQRIQKAPSASQVDERFYKCPRCGNQINSNWRFCKWCGYHVIV